MKSAVLNYLNSAKQKGEAINEADVAASFQQAIIDVLVEKTIEAAHATGQTKVTLAGGVSANRHLQDALAAACEKKG